MLVHRRQFEVDLEEEMRLHLELRQQERPSLSFRSGENTGIEFLEQLLVTRQEATIEQSQMKLHIVFFDALAFFNRAPRGAHAKPEVPQRARKIGNQGSKLLFGLFVPEQEKNIEIRMRIKEFAAVSTQTSARKWLLHPHMCLSYRPRWSLINQHHMHLPRAVDPGDQAQLDVARLAGPGDERQARRQPVLMRP